MKFFIYITVILSAFCGDILCVSQKQVKNNCVSDNHAAVANYDNVFYGVVLGRNFIKILDGEDKIYYVSGISPTWKIRKTKDAVAIFGLERNRQLLITRTMD